MKKFIQVLLVVSIMFSSISLAVINSVPVKAAESINISKENLTTTPIEKEIIVSNDDISTRALAVWAAWTLSAVAGAVVSEIVSEVYSQVKSYVYNSSKSQAANTNVSGSIYDINLYGDKFNAASSANHVGNGKTNNKTRVNTLQRVLNARGYNAGALDGYWGTNTRNALVRFQSKKGISADGIAGKTSWYYLQNK